jgi:hypothetical protein
MDEQTIVRFNRQLFTEDLTADEAARLYALVFESDRSSVGV